VSNIKLPKSEGLWPVVRALQETFFAGAIEYRRIDFARATPSGGIAIQLYNSTLSTLAAMWPGAALQPGSSLPIVGTYSNNIVQHDQDVHLVFSTPTPQYGPIGTTNIGVPVYPTVMTWARFNGASLVQSSLLDTHALGYQVANPSIAAAPDGRVVIGFSVSSSNHYLSSAYAVKYPNENQFRTPWIYTSGTRSLHVPPGVQAWGVRVGDFSDSYFDPWSNTFVVGTLNAGSPLPPGGFGDDVDLGKARISF
jgi:hypothetical protein